MFKRLFTLICLSSTGFALCACAPFSLDDKRAGMCNDLNSRIIFSGGTSNQRQAEIQNAEQPLMVRNYDSKCT